MRRCINLSCLSFSYMFIVFLGVLNAKEKASVSGHYLIQHRFFIIFVFVLSNWIDHFSCCWSHKFNELCPFISQWTMNGRSQLDLCGSFVDSRKWLIVLSSFIARQFNRGNGVSKWFNTWPLDIYLKCFINKYIINLKPVGN